MTVVLIASASTHLDQQLFALEFECKISSMGNDTANAVESRKLANSKEPCRAVLSSCIVVDD